MGMPVFCSTTFSVQPGPPMLNAELNCRSGARWAVALGSAQSGCGSIRSRGMLTTVALVRPADRCTSSVVSERSPDVSDVTPPNASASDSPSRVSEPITSTFNGGRSAFGSSGAGVAVGRFVPAMSVTSTDVMLPWSRT
jgi:hypothetical protein